ncbi:MAG: small basic protein [Planctomycetes bacterium]|nr:small basic protein [Planctomycetota bacterium]NQU49790.1 small basic protein [Planctomycetota bacterium]
MSIHKSLSLGSNLKSSRSVYTRRERLAKLSESGDFQEGDSVHGLRKVRTQYKTLSKKQLKALAAADKLKTDEAAAAAAAAAAEEEEL